MANTNAPFGFRPVKYRDGKAYTGACNEYYHDSGDSTALYMGDPVILAGSSNSLGVATVVRATAGSGAYVSGVVVGFRPDTAIPLGYGAASTGYYVLVADDPDLMYEIQEDGVGGAIALASVGLNADFVAGSGSTYTKRSGFMLDSSTAASTNTLQCKIHGFSQDPLNETATAYAKMLVSFNLHQMNNTTGV